MGSHIEIPAAEVTALAEDCINRVAKYRDEQMAALIASERRGYERSWWRRLLRLKTPSDGEIRHDLHRGGVWAPARSVGMYGWAAEAAAEKLLRAARLADTVRVSIEDLDMIGAQPRQRSYR